MMDSTWPTIGKLTSRALAWLVETRKGRAFIVVASIVLALLAMAHNAQAERGIFGYIGPVIVAPAIVVFSGVYLAICGKVGDFLADLINETWLGDKLDPAQPAHRTIYFIVSCVGFAAVLFALVALLAHV